MASSVATFPNLNDPKDSLTLKQFIDRLNIVRKRYPQIEVEIATGALTLLIRQIHAQSLLLSTDRNELLPRSLLFYVSNMAIYASSVALTTALDVKDPVSRSLSSFALEAQAADCLEDMARGSGEDAQRAAECLAFLREAKRWSATHGGR